MSRRFNNEDQFKFLISCIRWSNNGKVDFTEVAKECHIVTKGAAAKRYERMMKAHNIHQPSSCRENTVTVSRKSESVSQPSKKRKQDQFLETGDTAVDDDEDLGQIKDETGCVDPESTTVKDEVETPGGPVFGANYPWCRYPANRDTSTIDENDAFHEFIVSHSFEPINSTSHFGNTGAANSHGGVQVRMVDEDESLGSILIE